ncbi:hypothetical protein [Actinomyces bowdenii]|uniref:SWIM-type domain-containing protein n=1 Tax=Actinomyces bowdenii TaxID=131109 RepID=A0A853EIQ4_9ACTO|nr:hypothetical protein [Actinomyces bowdenii]MBF0696976.1 hypothetical protein [Actinomyces bowdenii]NYS69149.1 hypothetical protein [Actinomyces bowdenii]
MSEADASRLPLWTRVYAALDDQALAALASRGLVRRARGELAAAGARLVAADEGAAGGGAAVQDATGRGEITVEVGRGPMSVVLPDSGPQDARCPCPVAGVCVHIITACLWLQQAAGPHASSPAQEGSTGAPDSAAPPESSALARVLAWSIQDIEAAAGAAARRRVARALSACSTGELAASTRVAQESGSLTISWPQGPRVILTPELGPRGAIVSGRHSRTARAALALEAVVRLFATAGRSWPWPSVAQELTPPQRELLGQVLRSAETLIGAGLSHVGRSSSEELSRLAHTARLEQLPYLARLLSAAAGALSALARRDDAVDESRALSALAAAWSLALALDGTPGPAPQGLVGAARPRTVRTGRLIALSATWWQGLSGSRGLTMRLWDTEHERLESVSTGRAAGADPAFRQDSDLPLIWGTPVRGLLAGPIRLTGATRRADGTLSPAASTRVAPAGRLEEVDLAALSTALEEVRQGPGVAGFGPGAPPVRLILTALTGPGGSDGSGRYGRMDLDEVHQQFLWTVTDRAGAPHLLRLGGDELELVAALEAGELPVVAVVVEGSRLTAVLTRIEGALRVVSPTMMTLGRGDDARRTHLLTRWGAHLERLRSQAAVVPPPPVADPLAALLECAQQALAAVAAIGTGADTGGPAGPSALALRRWARQARDLNLETLAAALEEVAAAQGAAALLRATAILDRLRALAG